MAALSDAIPPDVWRQIVERARDQALAGDAKARAWLAGYLLRDAPALIDLAAAEQAGDCLPTNVARELRHQLLHEPDYLEYLRQRSLETNAHPTVAIVEDENWYGNADRLKAARAAASSDAKAGQAPMVGPAGQDR